MKTFQEFINESKKLPYDHDKVKENVKSAASVYEKRAKEEDDGSMKDMYKSDAKDIHKLHNHISKGEHKKAIAHYNHLDTAVRDDLIHKKPHFRKYARHHGAWYC